MELANLGFFEQLGHPQFWVAVVQIIIVDILLAGDNAGFRPRPGASRSSDAIPLSRKRRHHNRTVAGVIPSVAATAVGPVPSAARSTILLRSTTRDGCVRLLAQRSSCVRSPGGSAQPRPGSLKSRSYF